MASEFGSSSLTPEVGGTAAAEPAGAAARSAAAPVPHVDAKQLRVVQYSLKAVAVLGNSFAIKDALRGVGGKWNPNLTYRGARVKGWIFPATRTLSVNALVSRAGGKPLASTAACAHVEPAVAKVAASIASVDAAAADAIASPDKFTGGAKRELSDADAIPAKRARSE